MLTVTAVLTTNARYVMTKIRWVRVLALLMGFALIAAACSDDDSSSGDSTTTSTTEAADEPEPHASVDGVLALGSIMPLTGDLADFGPGMQAAVELAVEDVNAAGGVLDQDVTLESADSATDPDTTNTAATRLVGTENVDAVMGPAGSSVTLAGGIEPITGAGRLECSGSATGPQLTGISDYFFRTAPSDLFQGQLLGDTVSADGHGTVAIVHRADDYGEALATAFDEAVTANGVEVVTTVPVDPEGTNFDADVQAVVDEAPDAVMVVAFPEEGAGILTAMIEQGAGPADLPVYATDGLASDELAAAVDPDDPSVIDGIVGTRPGSTEEPTEFNTRLSDEKGVDEVTFAAQFYDCTILTALAAVAADSDDPDLMSAEIVGLTAGDTECTSYADCKTALEAGDTIKYVGVTQFVLSDDREPNEGVYETWNFVGGLMETLSTETVTKEA